MGLDEFFFCYFIWIFCQGFGPDQATNSQKREERKVNQIEIWRHEYWYFGFKHVLNQVRVSYLHGDIQWVLESMSLNLWVRVISDIMGSIRKGTS